ncbi:MAG: glycosyltransferase family 2 protein, partial [Clostridiales bacterium]|nr:glycosyltransferase family 2 protein [Clostridiales bacterium]
MIVVIPAYEPDEKLLAVVEQLKSETDYQIVVVDDGSSEEYRPLFDALETKAQVLHHEVNRGKGRAMKTAFEYIKNSGAFDAEDGIITADADGQHLLADIVAVSRMWENNREALVLGGRRFSGNVPLRSRFGNGVTRAVFAITTGVRVYDTQTGLRAFAVSAIDTMLAITGERYEYEINQLLYCTKTKTRIIEVPIETVYLDENKSSHFNTIRDSWRIYKTIFKFIGSSLISWLVDYVLLLVLNIVFTRLFGNNPPMLLTRPLDPTLPALIIARTVSSTVNYFINRKVVFDSGNKLSYLLYLL